MNKNDEVYSSWNKDYVDIHGRNLNVMLDDDGCLYVPLQEIRKTGFHIFPSTHFNKMMVGKTMITHEFQLHMLGAAKQYMIENSAHLSQEDILNTIELCRQKLMSGESIVGEPASKTTGILGRTLLSDPLEVKRGIRSAINQTIQNRSGDGISSRLDMDSIHNGNSHDRNDVYSRDQSRGCSLNDSGHALRRPHQQKSGGQNNGNQNRHNEDTRQSRLGNQQEQQQQNRNFNRGRDQGQTSVKRENYNLAPSEKVAARRETSSRSVSENEESSDFIRLNDCKINRIVLQQTMQKVKVVHIDESNDKYKYWVQLVDNEDQLLEILQKCMDCYESARVVPPKLGQMFVTQSSDDEMWYRVVVTRIRPVIGVNFVDFGNSGVTAEVRELPAELRSIPAQAVRTTLSFKEGQPVVKLTVDQVLSVTKVKEYTDGTILVSTEANNGGRANNNNSGSTSKRATQQEQPVRNEPQDRLEDTFMDRIKYSTALIDKEMVKIVGHSDGRFYLRNKEHHEKLLHIVAHIKDLPREQVRDVEIGQLVLCKMEGQEQPCRAVVRDIDDGLVTVLFVDFHKTDAVSLRSMYKVCRATAALPVALIESPLIKGYTKYGSHAHSLIEEMIANKEKLNVAMNGTEFDLIVKGKSLSEMLFPSDSRIERTNTKLTSPGAPTPREEPERTFREEKSLEKAPKTVEKAPKPAVQEPPQCASAKPLFEDMIPFVAPLGVGDYMLTSYKDPTDFNLTCTGEEESELLAKCTCIEVDDEEPYEPEVSEMVLGFFEGGWYRGAVLTAEDGVFMLLFVEYGNTAVVTKDKIRRLPKEFWTIPMMGLMCQMKVPPTEAVNNRLEELLKTENIYEVNLLSYDRDNTLYTVDIPRITEVLVREKLL